MYFCRKAGSAPAGADRSRMIEMRDRTMNTSDEDFLKPASLRVMQLIAVALILGAIAFLAIVLYLVLVQKQAPGATPPQNLPLISLIAAGFLVVAAVLSFVVPAAVARSTLRRIAAGTWTPGPGMEMPATDSGKLLVVCQTTRIVGLALLEGACFFACIAYLLEGQPFVLAVVAVGIGLMLARFPSEGRVRLWLEGQKEQLARAREEVGPSNSGE
jgi:hypothetical protein